MTNRTLRTLVEAVSVAGLVFGGAASAQSVDVGGQRVVPEEYVVEEGDTLWDLCEEFFAEPWRWANVWALNPHVTNPHWIYPGDILRLRAAAGEELRPGEPLKFVSYTVGSANAAQVSLNEGFIVERDLPKVGTVDYSTEEKRYLASGDPIYMTFPKLEEVRIGQQYSIYRVLKDVEHPRSGELVGQKVQVLGIAEVERVDEHTATGRVLRSFSEIERGDKLTPLLNHYQVVSPRQNLIDMRGVIVDSFREVAELGQFHIAFIDKGSKDGVQAGNRLFVLRRGDGRLEVEEEAVEKLPWEQVGEVMVMETQERNSTVIITRSLSELHVGDVVEMQRNY
ncbi:MAG: LysM peptidoglycan-binding domain-containing protein [Bradymonadia bacterium]|jgi:hypothetical protein